LACYQLVNLQDSVQQSQKSISDFKGK